MASPPPHLDFFSPEFNPLEALNTEGLQPPNLRVKPLDNLNKFRRLLPQELPESLANAPARVPRSIESISAQQRAKSRTSLLTEKSLELARKTPIVDIIAGKLKSGPLGLLVECQERRGRVQVWTRHSHGIRGTLVGFLQAVDKHLNMVLQDVDENYTVRRRVPRLVRKRGRVRIGPHSENEVKDVAEGSLDSCSGKNNLNKEASSVQLEAELEDSAGTTMEMKLFPKLEHRTRHLNQIFVRGDGVVMVRKLP